MTNHFSISDYKIKLVLMVSRIKLIKLFDKIFGALISKLITIFVNPKEKLKESVSKILIIRPGGIGDAVLLFPAIEILRKNYPDSVINILSEKRNSGVFEFCPYINNIFRYDSFDFFKIFNEKYDLVIDTEQWHKLSSVIAYITKAPTRIGFNTNSRSDLYTSSIKYSQDNYEAQSFMNLVEDFSKYKPIIDSDKKFVFINDDESLNLNSDFINNKSKSIGIFFGATVDERKWGIIKFSELANKLIDKGFNIVLLGGKVDEVGSQEFVSNIKIKEKITNFVGKTSLKETAYLITKLNLLISGDSGLMHLAYGLGTKTLSLFGAGIETKWAPKGKQNFVINKKLPCSPCTSFGYTPSCPIGVKCLRDITVEEVYLKAISILDI